MKKKFYDFIPAVITVLIFLYMMLLCFIFKK